MWRACTLGREINRHRRGVGQRTVVGTVGDGHDFISTGHGKGGGGIRSDGGWRCAGGVIDAERIWITADAEALDYFLKIGGAVAVSIAIAVQRAVVVGVGGHRIEA